MIYLSINKSLNLLNNFYKNNFYDILDIYKNNRSNHIYKLIRVII